MKIIILFLILIIALPTYAQNNSSAKSIIRNNPFAAPPLSGEKVTYQNPIIP